MKLRIRFARHYDFIDWMDRPFLSKAWSFDVLDDGEWVSMRRRMKDSSYAEFQWSRIQNILAQELDKLENSV